MTSSMDFESREELLRKATSELTDVATAIDRLYDCSNPSMELIEATRAIHGALSAVGALDASLSDARSSPPLGGAVSSSNGDVSLRFEARSWVAHAPDSIPISILYNDLLEPTRVRPDSEKTLPTAMMTPSGQHWKEADRPCK